MTDMIAKSDVQERWLDIHASQFPEQERATASAVSRFATNVCRYHSRYVRATALFKMAEKNLQALIAGTTVRAPGVPRLPDFENLQMQAEWVTIATKEGALATSHFGKSLFSVINNARKNATMAAKIDMKLLGQAVANFNTKFPRIFSVRDLIAHEWELVEERNRYTCAVDGIDGQDNIVHSEGDKIIGTINGVVAEFSFSADGLRSLSRSRDMMIESFELLGSPFMSTVTKNILSAAAATD